ncbi:hypothetical protein, partial [Xanthomonas albilineans]|uniref:hypothetical protein n=1 Tax=Xanthomonas albilineans TaxID=29447 RepID=UPI001E33751A
MLYRAARVRRLCQRQSIHCDRIGIRTGSQPIHAVAFLGQAQGVHVNAFHGAAQRAQALGHIDGILAPRRVVVGPQAHPTTAQWRPV